MDMPVWFGKVVDASKPDVIRVAWCISFTGREAVPRLDGKFKPLCKCTPFHKFDPSRCK